jgi:uncharacterized protein YjiS (DUF1127 family)
MNAIRVKGSSVLMGHLEQITDPDGSGKDLVMLALTTPRPALGTVAPRRSRGLIARLAAALALHRQRQHLAELDDAILNDIGLTREDALREAARPVWDAPAHWRR